MLCEQFDATAMAVAITIVLLLKTWTHYDMPEGYKYEDIFV